MPRGRFSALRNELLEVLALALFLGTPFGIWALYKAGVRPNTTLAILIVGLPGAVLAAAAYFLMEGLVDVTKSLAEAAPWKSRWVTIPIGLFLALALVAFLGGTGVALLLIALHLMNG